MLRFLTESSQNAFTIRLHVRKYQVDFFREALKSANLYIKRSFELGVCLRL